MTTYRFCAQALTPIHIGCGTEIDPTAFVLNGSSLIQINPVQVIGDLSAADRERFIALNDRADLKEIQNFIKSKVDIHRHTIARVDVSEKFRREFEVKASNPNNQFNVIMMPRSSAFGTVYLPGSSIKGAIRTAVVNYFANHVESSKSKVRAAVKIAKTFEKSKALEESALNFSHREMERDVFRLIHLEDVHIPDGSTRIDKVSNYNPRRPGAENIQMWFERLKSFADSPTPPSFNVMIRIDDRAMHDSRTNAILGQTVDLSTLMQACNHFYWKRMQSEGDEFDGRQSDSGKWKAIHNCFPRGRLNGQVVPIDPSQSFWNSRDYGMHYILLRIGRFSHFESLSVDELRQGYNVRTREPIKGMGSTRTRCEMENGKPPMPFGWLLLKLEGTVR